MRFLKTTALAAVLAASTTIGYANPEAATPANVVDTYANIALLAYQDSLSAAIDLQSAINAFIASPNDITLAAAKQAWFTSRVPYQQTEAFRFGNAIVDDWEGRVNAWPLDEGLIDYVDAGAYGAESDTNAFYTANVIANETIMLNGTEIHIPEITAEVLADVLHESAESESNVATGYHAIEFLLWGQDLNGTGAGAGNRPATDFDTANCTNGNCDRRAEYLSAATDLLVADLEEMVANWEANGPARVEVTADPQAGLIAILTGMGSLSYGELAGERMKLGLLLHDPEETHDCFSDNTANSHLFDIKGINNVYFGEYNALDGRVVRGPSLADLVAKSNPALNDEMVTKLQSTMSAAHIMAARAMAGEAVDQMIGEGNTEGNQVMQGVIDGLVDQTATIERVVVELGLEALEVEGSDSLDNPNAVFN